MKSIAAFLLTWIAGFVDAVGFLHYGRIYTANMSGNSVSFGINAVLDVRQAVHHAWPIAFYIIGLLGGRLLLEVGFRRQIGPIASIVFALEIGLTLLALWSGQWAGVAVLALAMGMQNATLTRFGNLKVHSGFVTGTLLKATEYAVQYATWLYDHTLGGNLSGSRGFERQPVQLSAVLRLSIRERSFRLTCELSALWLVYVLGASGGALGERRYSVPALVIPCAVLLLLTAMDLRRPLSVEDEREQGQVET